MDKFLYFRTVDAIANDDATGDSAIFPVSSFLGGEPTSDTSITLFFKSMKNSHNHDDHTISDSVVLTTATNKAKEAFKIIVDAIAGNTFSKISFITVIDDVTDTGIATDIITECGAITIDAQHTWFF